MSTRSLYPQDAKALDKQLDGSKYAENGNVKTKEESSMDIANRLIAIERLLKVFLRHMECITQTEFDIDDLEK